MIVGGEDWMSYLGGPILAAEGCDRTPRLRRLICARMSNQRLGLQDIVIRNISRFGLSAASRGLPPTQGERITIALPHGEKTAGTVKWVEGLSFGIKLDQELNLEALASALQRLRDIGHTSADWEVRRLHRIAPAAPANLRRL